MDTALLKFLHTSLRSYLTIYYLPYTFQLVWLS
jgi:hypothetical protein